MIYINYIGEQNNSLLINATNTFFVNYQYLKGIIMYRGTFELFSGLNRDTT